MDARKKLIAETGLSETKIILGWLLNFRTMTISLPENKYIAYSRAISNMIERGWTSKAELESNIGRWVHLGQILPQIHHFLSRLRFLLKRLQNKRQLSINQECIADIQFLLSVLVKCRDGIDMNTLSYRKPTHVYRSDSCPAGMGGYSDEGYAWRYYLPPELQFRASNNLLEHLAAIITPWIDIIAGRLTHGDCALSMTDSTTSEGWLRKSNFIKDGESPIQATIRLEVACHHALHYLNNGIREYSQWFCGVENNVANALSRDDDRLDNIHRNPPISLLLTGSSSFQDCTVSQRDNLMADLASATAAAEEGVGGGTHANDARAWSRYTKYCNSIGLNGNYFLDGMPQQHKLAIMGAFAVAVREGRFLRPTDGPLAKKSVSDTVNAVAATFRENGREDPH